MNEQDRAEITKAVDRVREAESALAVLTKRVLPLGSAVRWEHGEYVRSGRVVGYIGYGHYAGYVLIESSSGARYGKHVTGLL